MVLISDLRSIQSRRPIKCTAPSTAKLLTFARRGLFSCFRSTQTHGYKFLFLPNRPKYETIFWILALTVISSVTIWMILYVYIPVLSKPTVTTEMPFSKSIRYLPFPTVAFCTMNRISRSALMNYSASIFIEQKKHSINLGNTTEEIYENLRPLALVYQTFLDVNDFTVMDGMHSMLLKLYGGTYPLRNIVNDIAPKCSDMIKHCMWRGQEINCSEYVQERHSFIGKCCYFNYARPIKDQVLDFKRKQIPLQVKEPLQVSRAGFDNGLAIVINQMIDDYSHTVQDYIGTNVFLIDSTVYLNELSGSVLSRILQPDEELFMSVDAFVVVGSDNMRPYKPSLRQCFFQEETVLNKLYTQSECILDCRIRDVIEMCGCLPVPFSDIYRAPDCLLDDFNCLSSWTEQWLQSRTKNKRPMEDSRESIEPKCPHCLKRCNYIQYLTTTSKADFDATAHNKMSDRESFLIKNDMRGHSIVHINYKQNRFPLFEQKAAYMWFDLFGMFGGLCGLTFGGSIISVIELIYYGTGRFGTQLTTTARNRSNDNRNASFPIAITSATVMPPVISIYLNELIQYKNVRIENWRPVRRTIPTKISM